MNLNAKKLAVLTALQACEKPVSLSQLLKILGPDFAERTVIRQINDLIKANLVIKKGQRRNALYHSITFNFSPPSLTAIRYIQKPIFERVPVGYRQEWFDQYVPNSSCYLSDDIGKRLQNEGLRELDENPAGTYARKIYNPLLIDLSYNSSRLEGNTYSLLDTEKLILDGAEAEGKLDAEKVMILNHKDAIRHMVESAEKEISLYDEVCTLHYLLSDGLVAPKYSGKVRDQGVRISATTYIPLENPDRIEIQLKNICNKANQIQDPFEKSFFLLVHISYLQAFIDVNVRTARIAANIPLINANLVPLSFSEVDKDDYISAMICIYELNEIKPLSEIYMNSYIRSCRTYDITAEAIGYDEVRVKYRHIRRQLIRNIVIEHLIGKSLEDYINDQSIQNQRFQETVFEDLKEIGVQSISGLGITIKELEDYLQKLNHSKD
jgi:Fic family protein